MDKTEQDLVQVVKSKKIDRFQALGLGIFMLGLLMGCGYFCWPTASHSTSPHWYQVSIDQPERLITLADSLRGLDHPAERGVTVHIIFRHYRSHPLKHATSPPAEALAYLQRICAEKQIPFALELALKPPAGLKVDHIRPGYVLTNIAGLLMEYSAYPPYYICFQAGWFETPQLCQQVFTFVQESRQIPALAPLLMLDQSGALICPPSSS